MKLKKKKYKCILLVDNPSKSFSYSYYNTYMNELLTNLIKALGTFILITISSLNFHTLKSDSLNLFPENKVINVIDGDTIDIYQNNKVERVRLLGINTPETVDPRKGVECYGPEASQKLKEILTDKIVKIEGDPSQEDKDKYGRLLRYIFLNDENINEKMVKEGYAFEYTYNKHLYLYQKEFWLQLQTVIFTGE